MQKSNAKNCAFIPLLFNFVDVAVQIRHSINYCLKKKKKLNCTVMSAKWNNGDIKIWFLVLIVLTISLHQYFFKNWDNCTISPCGMP
jgi:hypothetical protein